MRSTFAVVDLEAIGFNLRQVRKRVNPANIMAVVKANAYGHGVLPVAKKALSEGVDYLGVALVEEGIELRQHGIQAPILVFGGFFEDQIPLFLEHDLEFTLYTEKNLIALKELSERSKKTPKVQIKVDTGMGRAGIPYEQAEKFIASVAGVNEIELIGLYTHFATSDERDKSFANLQLKRFREIVERTRKRGIRIPIVHAANSGAILDMPDSYFDMVRPGIMMYGYYPSTETTESLMLKPAMTFKSKVLFLKDIAPGTSVSYGRKFVASERTRIATIPMGYADGYNRLLTNQGKVSIRGHVYPVVGRVCMDQILVDVGLDSQVEVGNEVILFGPGYGREVSVEYMCKVLQTIPYEICCWISHRVPRVFENDRFNNHTNKGE